MTMAPKLFSRASLVAALLFLATAAAAAQTVQISGKVTLKQADGTVVPVKGAVVDIYRTDIKQKFEATTDRNGAYLLPAIPFIGTYTLAVSAPGARPDYRTGVRFGRQPVNDFAIVPGDGSRLTLEQIKELATAPSTNTPVSPESPEAKAAREEMDRKVKAIEEQNRKITQDNEVLSRTFQAGNEALSAGRVDDAIVQYREGIGVRPDEPALLTNLSEALRRRGVNRYNAAVNQQGDRKSTEMEAAKKDWSEAAQMSRKALDIIKSAPAPNAAEQQNYQQNQLSALATYFQAMRLVATKVDQTQAAAAWDAYKAYSAVDTDPNHKAKLRDDALQMLFDAGSIDLAVAEARKLLVAEPNHSGANRVLGLALFASGEKANFQEAANHLQRYVEVAPDTDPLKASARDSLEYLKTAEGITPQRTKATSSGRRSPN